MKNVYSKTNFNSSPIQYRVTPKLRCGRRFTSFALTLVMMICTFLSFDSNAQSETHVFQEWAKHKGVQNMFHHTKSITDNNSNVYQIGSSINSAGNYDIMVVKYNKFGTEIWVDVINGSANSDDHGADIIIDNSGKIIITGTVFNYSTANDVILRKYNPNGSVIWTQYYNGTENLLDAGTALDIGSNNDVYVGGGTLTTSSQSNYLILKYNSGGVLQWNNTYDYVNLQEVVVKIDERNGAVYASGISQYSTEKWEIATARLDDIDGAVISVYRTGGTADSIDEVTDVDIDSNGNIYVVGGVVNTGTGFDMKIVKLDEDLNFIWTKEINGADNLNDLFNGVQVDASGNVYVTGYVTTANNSRNMYTAKYNSAGTQLWNSQHDGTDHGSDYGQALVLDAAGNVYVAGSSYHVSNMDYCTVKYNNSGVQQWMTHFNSEANEDDKAIDITLDEDDDVIVVGQADFFDGKKRYYTVKYSEKDVIIPPDEEVVPSSSYFIENKGQLKKYSGSSANAIRYYNTQVTPGMFVADDKLSIQFYESIDENTSNLHRVDMIFNKGNSNKKVYSLESMDSYTNFLGGNIPNGERERILHQKMIYTPEVWTNVDVMYSSNKYGIKVYYICKPGFNPNTLGIEFAGQDGLSVSGTSLVVENSIEDLSFTQAEAYQVNSLGQRINMTWVPSYTVSGNDMSLNLGTYTSTQTLIIEMDQGYAQSFPSTSQVDNLLWSTFFGGMYDDDTKTTVVHENLMWVGGSSESSLFLDEDGPSIELAFLDGYVANFNLANAELYWISILDGSSNEQVLDIDINPETKHCYAVGFTSSSNLISPSAQGINDIVNDGASAGFIYEINDNGGQNEGSLQSLVDGDGKGELCRAVKYELFNNGVYEPRIYIAGRSDKGLLSGGSLNFPIQQMSGAYNQSASPGDYEGFLMVLDENYDNMWCTYFGSDEDDEFSDIVINKDKIHIVGSSQASSESVSCNVPTNGGLPICINGSAYSQTSLTGGIGHFITQFSTSGGLIWSTYVASGGFDLPSVAVVNNEGAEVQPIIYVTGQTASNGLLNTVNNDIGNYYIDTSGLNTGGYICKFGESGFLTWKSYLSGTTLVPKSISALQGETSSGLGLNKGFVMVGYTAMNAGSPPLNNDCLVPSVGSFPNCDSNGDNYNEDNDNSGSGNRMVIMNFDENNDLLWSTIFGDDIDGSLTDVEYTQERIIAVGSSDLSNTLEEFDTGSEIDYYNPNLQMWDGTIAMFESETEFTVGIDELGIDNKITLYPNPVENELGIIVEKENFDVESIVVFSGDGRQIVKRNYRNVSNFITLDVSSLAQGMYLIQIIGKNNISYVERFTKL